MSGYGGGGYLPDDCSGCHYCGEAMLGRGACAHCSSEIVHIYPILGLDADGRDKAGRNRSGLAWGYLLLHGYAVRDRPQGEVAT